MALTEGTIELVDKTSTTVEVSWTAATDGTGAVTDQLQRRRSKQTEPE